MKNLEDFYTRNLYGILLIMIILFLNNTVSAQDNINSTLSRNTPTEFESTKTKQQPTDQTCPDYLNRDLKQAFESGNKTEAGRISDKIEKYIPKKNIFKTVYDNDFIIERKNNPEAGEWLTTDQLVYNGQVRGNSTFKNQIAMKMGEDGNMYLAVNRHYSSEHTGRIDFYNSTDGGINWRWFLGISNPTIFYYGSLSMLVETRSSTSNPDSTRIFIFYNRSTNPGNNDGTLNYFSFLRNGSAFYGGQIAAPVTVGNEISYLSAVSDGQFWSEATYLGIVCSESTNSYANVRSARVFRSTDWGNTWIQSVLDTDYDDHFPSADFKCGNGYSTDSIWIAFERRFTPENTHIRVISANWNPTSTFYTYYITVGVNKYEKPCLTIKQNNPIDSAIITTFKNQIPVYLNTTNGGNAWYADYFLGSSGSEQAYTYCESSANSSEPFVAIWVSRSSDSLNVRRGVVGNLGSTHHQKNSNTITWHVTPVCAVYTPNVNINRAAFAYTKTGIINVYADREDWRGLTLRVIPEGMYNPVSNRLNAKDTVRVKIRRSTAPFTIIDSAKSEINNFTFQGIYELSNTPPGNYYIVVKHRNSIETWSKFPVTIGSGEVSYNFTSAMTQAYGNNLKQVDFSPVVFGIFSGDVNQDWTVDLTDASLIDNDANNFVSGYVNTDITGDNFVDLTDAVIAANNASNFVSVIRP
ncbi:MAG: hypothetical protein M3R36_05110 [Bacteroidota bacterium]|nr:hypothetical protein [Bacteroidota bacterium]